MADQYLVCYSNLAQAIFKILIYHKARGSFGKKENYFPSVSVNRGNRSEEMGPGLGMQRNCQLSATAWETSCDGRIGFRNNCSDSLNYATLRNLILGCNNFLLEYNLKMYHEHSTVKFVWILLFKFVRISIFGIW